MLQGWNTDNILCFMILNTYFRGDIRMDIQDNVYYTEKHEWIDLEEDESPVGISDYAQSQLGDIVFIELPQIGDSVNAGDVIAEIESVKAVSEIYAPVSGTICAVNTSLEESPETINTDPYNAGWICKITEWDETEKNDLMSAEDYEAMLEEQDE